MKNNFIIHVASAMRMHGKALVIAGSVVLIAKAAEAQQTPVLSHYYYNQYLINPATAGHSGGTEAFLHYRQQWVGVPGAPQTQALTVDGPLDHESKLGVGININNDESDIIGRFSAMLTAAYRLPVSEHHELSFGMSGGVIRNQLRFDRVRGDLSDPGLLQNSENRSTFEGNAGLIYRFRKFKAGLVSEQLFSKRFTYQNAADFREISYVLVRHYLVSLQYNFQLDRNFDLTPLVVVRSAQGLPAQIDVNAMLKYQDIVWTNIGYRHETGIGLSMGAKIAERFIVGYNYELPTSDIRHTSSGSHEFMIGMRLHHRQHHRTPSQRVVNNKVIEEYKKDTHAQFEKLDEIQQKNEALNQQLAEYKKVIEQQNNEIEQLKKTVGASDDELKSTIERLMVDLQKEDTFDKGSVYYLVIGAVRTFEDAKAFQRVIRRETKLKPDIIQNDNQTWYFIYSDELKSVSEANQKIKALEDANVRPYIIGNPWVYRTTKKN